MIRKINMFIDFLMFSTGIFVLFFVIPIGDKYPDVQPDLDIVLRLFYGLIMLSVVMAAVDYIKTRKDKNKVRNDTIGIIKEWFKDILIVWGIMILGLFPWLGSKHAAIQPELIKDVYVYVLLVVIQFLIYKYLDYRNSKK